VLAGLKERGVTHASLDGEPAVVENGAARLPLKRDGKRHFATIRL
jgi:hypothetical protein